MGKIYRRYRTRKIGAKRFYILPRKRDTPAIIFHYAIGNRTETDAFYNAVKAHLGVTDLVMRRRILGTKIKKYDRPRFAYQVLPRIYQQLNAVLQADCSATKLPANWYEFVPDDV